MHSDAIRNRLLAVIALVMGVAAVKLAYPVLMPIVVAFFVIAAAWPIRKLIGDRWSASIGYTATIAVLAVGLALFFGVIYFAMAEVVRNFLDQQDKFRDLYNRYTHWSDMRGLPPIGGTGGYDRLAGLVRSLLAEVYSVLSYMGLVAVIVVMGFPEVPKLAEKFRRQFESGERRSISLTVESIADGLRSYLAMTVVSSLITGVASGLWAWAMGLELAMIWGILNFLLNFIPIIGNVLGVLPPTLYAIIQYDNLPMPLAVFTGFVVLQLVISNFVYPMLQARGLSMPPITIIISLLFWGWLWGFAGALLAIPLTAVVINICRQFEATEKFAIFVGRRREE